MSSSIGGGSNNSSSSSSNDIKDVADAYKLHANSLRAKEGVWYVTYTADRIIVYADRTVNVDSIPDKLSTSTGNKVVPVQLVIAPKPSFLDASSSYTAPSARSYT